MLYILGPNNTKFMIAANCKICGREIAKDSEGGMVKINFNMCPHCDGQVHQDHCKLHVPNGTECSCDWQPNDPPEDFKSVEKFLFICSQHCRENDLGKECRQNDRKEFRIDKALKPPLYDGCQCTFHSVVGEKPAVKEGEYFGETIIFRKLMDYPIGHKFWCQNMKKETDACNCGVEELVEEIVKYLKGE